jgi:activator-of-BECN1-regulated-autophagy protein 1
MMDHPKPAFSWDYDTGAATRRRQEETPVVVQPIPSRETMMKRWAFRDGIGEETLQHRRIQRHGGMGDTGRNISLVLRDRERFGARGVITNRRRAKHQMEKTTSEENGCNGAVEQQEQQGKLLRRVSYPMTIFNEVQTFTEYCSVIRYHSAFFHHLGGEDERGEQGERPASSKAVSTISIAFSPDSQTMASTHGDHTVKITCCSTGRLLQTLEGHPRTPWTVKYHPTDQNILASGCLGHQVRVWNWKDNTCLQMIRLEFAIISLSFHPGGEILAIANGTRLHFWGYGASAAQEQDRNANNSNGAAQQQQQPRAFRGMLTEVEQRHMLRCVHFPPDGNSIIVGGVNQPPPTEDARRRGRSGISGGGMSFYLRMWDFDVDAALRPFVEGSTVLRRRAISNVSSMRCMSSVVSLHISLFLLFAKITL